MRKPDARRIRSRTRRPEPQAAFWGQAGRHADALLELADGGRSLLGRIRLPLKSSVLLAALRALSEVWTFDPRAAAVVVTAAESPDPDIRAAVLPPLS